MAEETSNPTPTPAPAAPAVDLSAKVKMADGSEVSIGDLVKSRSELESVRQDHGRLAKFREVTQSMIASEDPNQKIEALGQVLADLGYSREQIAQITAQPEPDEDDTPAPRRTRGGKSRNEPDGDDRILALEEEINRLQAGVQEGVTRSRRETAARFSGILDSQVRSDLESKQEHKKFVDKIRELNTKDAEKSIKIVQEDAKKRSLERLREQKALSGVDPTEDDIRRAGSEALDEVMTKYRSVIGDPNKLGILPETASGFEELANTRPVPRPEYKAGDTIESVRERAQSWTTDKLTRLAATVNQGESKI